MSANARYRELAFSLLGKKCAKCWFDDERALQFDHIEPCGLGQNRVGNSAYHCVRAGGVGFQVLCANCHAIKTKEDIREMVAKRVKKANEASIREGKFVAAKGSLLELHLRAHYGDTSG